MDTNARLVRTNNALTTPVEEELVMFDTEAGKYYGLNEVATAIWNRLQNPQTIGSLINSLTAEFEISEEQCRKEVRQFLSDMINRGLVEES